MSDDVAPTRLYATSFYYSLYNMIDKGDVELVRETLLTTSAKNRSNAHMLALCAAGVLDNRAIANYALNFIAERGMYMLLFKNDAYVLRWIWRFNPDSSVAGQVMEVMRGYDPDWLEHLLATQAELQ